MGSINEIEILLANHYNLKTDEIEAMVGGVDLNFKITDDLGKNYVLKLSPDIDQQSLIQEQHQVLDYLSQGSMKKHFQRVIRDKKNQDIFRCSYKDKEYLVRLLSFLEGTFWGEQIVSGDLHFKLGVFLAEMDQQLSGIRTNEIQLRNYEWDIANFPLNEKYFPYIQDPYRRNLVEYFLLQFRALVQPQIGMLRKSTIHSDANDWNILISDETITGLIDFGDIVYSPLINELAVAISYAISDQSDPLIAASRILSGYHSVIGIEEKELNLLYYLVAARMCISVSKSAYGKSHNPDNEYLQISDTPMWDMLQKWICINPIKAENIFRESCDFPPLKSEDINLRLNKRHQYFSKSLGVSYKSPIRMMKGAMQYMYDDEGNTYLDCVNNISHVGHAHPKVVNAGYRQMTILNTNTRYLNDSMYEYADMLLAKFPTPLNKVFFVNSGSAATDLAYRMAVTHTGRRGSIVVGSAYHGNTTIGIQLSPYKYEHEGGPGPSQHIYKVESPDLFRGAYRDDQINAARKYVDEIRTTIGKAEADNHSIGSFFCESIQGCAGQIVLPAGYLKEAYRTTREAGGVCVADEVQVGFGRVGSHFWGFETQDVVPDIVILGKPMGNGHPLAAVVTTDEIVKSFENGLEFFSSFGGNPVSCEIGKAVLEVIEEQDLQKHAFEVGSYLISMLNDLKNQHTIIGDVRGMGFFIGIELVKSHETREPATKEASCLVNMLRQKGILLSTDGPYENVIKFKPPMVLQKWDADRLVDELDLILGDAAIFT